MTDRAKLKNVEEAEQKSIERMRQLYQNEDARWGPGRIVGSSKGSLMKKSRDDFVNSQEVRNLTALRQNAVQKNDRPLCIREPGGFSSNGSSSNSQGSRALQRR
nr:PREDICTED: uncharacterized protein LOC108217469 [Daucus carota subsp. sativus]